MNQSRGLIWGTKPWAANILRRAWTISEHRLHSLLKMQNTYRYVAVHEAGHAVASWHVQQMLGRDRCQFERVFIRTPEEVSAGPYIDQRGRPIQCIGLMEGPSRYNPGVFNPISAPPDIRSLHRQNMEAEVITSLAGPIAEARIRKCSLAAAYLVGGKDDYDMAKRCVADFEGEADMSEAFGKLQERAGTIVRQRWSSVLALADKLRVHRSVTGPEAVTVIEAALI
jgi:hypothetical protein